MTFERNVPVQDAPSGAMVDHWVALSPGAWAAIEPLSGRALIAAQAAESDVSVNIIVRHRADVSSDMRIVHRRRVHYISAILEDKRSGVEYMTILCTDLPHE